MLPCSAFHSIWAWLQYLMSMGIEINIPIL